MSWPPCWRPPPVPSLPRVTDPALSPRRRKARMVRPGPPPDDLVVVLRATPGSLEAALDDIADAALQSAAIYVVEDGPIRCLLFGVSVFAVPAGGTPADVLDRFAAAPSYVEATVGALRVAGFPVIPTGANPDHYDVQLLDRVAENENRAAAAVKMAAMRVLAVAGPLRPNPAYAGGGPTMTEEPR